MKALFAALLVTASFSAHSVTWWVGDILYGNVCRAGGWYTVYPTSMGQPVGTACPVRNNYGTIIGYGHVTRE